MSRICVIIPMYGKAEYTRNCIEFTLRNAGIEFNGIDNHILVVDDGSPEPFEFKDERVLVLRLPENTGFTNAVNEGILWAGERYDYVHLLNNDTEPEPDFIKILLDLMEANPVIGIAGSARILDTETQHKIELYGADLIRGYQLCTDGNINEEVIYTYWIPLCSALIRFEMIRYIGLLDRRMKIWCSDNDYCIRANFNGYNVALAVKSKVKHKHAVTTDSIQRQRKHTPEDDQRILIEKMAGMQYAELMTKMPLDADQKTYGKIEFTVYQR